MTNIESEEFNNFAFSHHAKFNSPFKAGSVAFFADVFFNPPIASFRVKKSFLFFRFFVGVLIYDGWAWLGRTKERKKEKI